MYIIHHPSPASTLFHHLGAITLDAGRLSVVITSRSPEPLPVPAGANAQEWVNTLEVPIAEISEQAIADWLVSAEGYYAGGEIVSDEAFEIAGRKAHLHQKVKAARDQRKNAGLVTTFGTVQTDLDSRLNLTGAVSMASILGASFAIDWRMADDTIVPLDAAQMTQLGLLVGGFVSDCQAAKNQLDAAIGSAATVEQLEAIDVDAGWPA